MHKAEYKHLPKIRELLAQGDNVRIAPGGISMLPTLRPNQDIVILSPISGRLKKYDVAFYQRENGQCVLHRVIEVSETYTFIGDHQFRKEPGITDEQLIARMSGFVRNGKEHSVEEPMYRLYCKLWHHTRKLRHVIKWPKYYLRRVLMWLKLKP